ncbi:MAG TPA: hypothetical protein VIM51_06065 [Desulfosporosinus sp.]
MWLASSVAGFAINPNHRTAQQEEVSWLRPGSRLEELGRVFPAGRSQPRGSRSHAPTPLRES